jgi:hypothetical protein
VTMRVCPNGWVCHAVRAPGSNVTPAPAARAGSAGLKSGSMRTVPVNQSSGPKTANPKHMESNAALDFTISEDDMERLGSVPHIEDYGEASMMPVFGGKLRSTQDPCPHVIIKLWPGKSE